MVLHFYGLSVSRRSRRRFTAPRTALRMPWPERVEEGDMVVRRGSVSTRGATRSKGEGGEEKDAEADEFVLYEIPQMPP